MTKKHFIAIANAISTIADLEARYIAAKALADELQHHNSRFDVCKFLLACKAVDIDDPRR